MKHHPDDGPWGLLGSGIALLLIAKLGVGLALVLPRNGLMGLLALVALALVSVGIVATTPPFRSVRPWRWLRPRPKPLGGEARWATVMDLWKAGWLRRQGWPIGVYRACWGLIPLTLRIGDQAQSQHTLLVAPNGQGKTESVFKPIVASETRIRRVEQRHTLLIVDAKGTVMAEPTLAAALATSHDLLVWNPAQPEKSTVAIDVMHWIPPDPTDPLYPEACDTVAKAYLAATYRDETGATSSYVADPYWQKQVSSVFTGLLLYLRALDPTLTLLDVARYVAEVEAEDMVRHLTSHPRTEAAKLRGASFKELLYNERARGAVVGDLIERLAILTDPRLERVMTAKELPLLDVDALLARPTALVLQVGALGDSTLPLLAVVLAAIQAELVRKTRGGQRLPIGIRILVDEGLLRIHGLETGVALMREANLGYLISVQATDQLRTNYGRDRAETILANLTHRLVLGGTTDSDAEWVCKHLGERKAYRDLPGSSRWGDETTHYTREEWPLLRPDQLRHMRYQMVVDSSHILPVRLRLRRYRARR